MRMCSARRVVGAHRLPPTKTTATRLMFANARQVQPVLVDCERLAHDDETRRLKRAAAAAADRHHFRSPIDYCRPAGKVCGGDWQRRRQSAISHLRVTSRLVFNFRLHDVGAVDLFSAPRKQSRLRVVTLLRLRCDALNLRAQPTRRAATTHQNAATSVRTNAARSLI